MAQNPDMDGGIKIYLREIGKTDLLTPDQEVELAERIKKGDPEARSHMIRANLRLVVKIAQDYANYGLPLLDLISEGNIGLMKEVERFDPNKGGKLSTYAAWWIKQSIKRALANQSKTIRLPVHMVDKLSKMRRVAMAMSEELGREPTDDELSEEIGIDRGKLAQLKAAGMRPASLDAPISEDDSTEFGEIVGDPNAIDAGAHLMSKDDHSKMLPLLDCLDSRERDILERRFGLNGHTVQTLEEVGLVYEVTRERIRQLQNIAIRKLRRRLSDLNNPLKRKIRAENDTEGDKKTPKSTMLNDEFIKAAKAQLAASKQVKKATPEPPLIQPSTPVPVKSSPVIPVISSAVTSILTSVTSQGIATVHLDKKPIVDPHNYSPYRKVLARDMERAGRKSELRKLLAMEMSDAIDQLGKIVLENVFFSGDDGSPEQVTWESIARPMAQYRFGDDVPEITGKEVLKIVAEMIGVSYPVTTAPVGETPKPKLAVVEMNQVIDETTVVNLYHKLRRMDMTLPIHLDAALSARLVSLASALVGRQRDVILLRYFNAPDQAQLTQQQVAHMLGMSNQTIVSINERAALTSIMEQISSDLTVPVSIPVPVPVPEPVPVIVTVPEPEVSERLPPEKDPNSTKNRLIIKCYRGDGDVLAIDDFHELGHTYGLTGYQVVQRLFWTKTISRDLAKQILMNGEHGLAKKDEKFIEEFLI